MQEQGWGLARPTTILDEALRARIDQRVLDRVLAQEKRVRKDLLARLS